MPIPLNYLKNSIEGYIYNYRELINEMPEKKHGDCEPQKSYLTRSLNNFAFAVENIRQEDLNEENSDYEIRLFSGQPKGTHI